MTNSKQVQKCMSEEFRNHLAAANACRTIKFCFFLDALSYLFNQICSNYQFQLKITLSYQKNFHEQ